MPPLPRFISREHFIQKAKEDPFSKSWPMGKSLHTVYDRHTIMFFFADLEDLIDVIFDTQCQFVKPHYQIRIHI